MSSAATGVRSYRALVLGLACAAAIASPAMGVGLNPPSNKTDKFAWLGASTTDYNKANIKVNNVDIGSLEFTYRRFTNSISGPPIKDRGGLALSGGFTGTGNNPYPDWPVTTATFQFMQVINTNAPAAGRRAEGYVDADDPLVNPFYPFQTSAKNGAGDAFTRGFYDGPQRFEKGTKVDWSAELMLTQGNFNQHMVWVIGSFNWGFSIAGSATNDNDTMTVTESGFGAFGDASKAGIDSAKAELKGTKTKQGWTVFSPSYATGFGPPRPPAPPAAPAPKAMSMNNGTSTILVEDASARTAIDRVLVFPRNHALANFAGSSDVAGWTSSAWVDGTTAPDGLEMYQPGILFSGSAFDSRTASFSFDLSTGSGNYGHESFFDMYLHTTDGDWVPFVDATQQLLGDFNADGQVTPSDLSGWDQMYASPSLWESQTGMNSLWAGDFTHDGLLGLDDRALFLADVSVSMEFDAIPEGFVPEPGVASLLAVAGTTLMLGRRRSRK